jgi:magnesium-protoporphyrin O-methyltransferase
MPTLSYLERRGKLETYFDRTAVDAWKKLTSDAPVGRIRELVRAGRDEMRGTILSWLPTDLSGLRILDAGCGTGALAIEMARRGADVVGIDLSASLIELARSRMHEAGAGRVNFKVGDMLHPALGRFDHIICMDSLIHYVSGDMIEALARFGLRADRSIIFTYAPSTTMLALKHAVGRVFPRSNRAPAIEPVTSGRIGELIEKSPGLSPFATKRTRRIQNMFYISQALEMTRT